VGVDTDGRLLLPAVSPAKIHESHGGVALLRISRRPWPFIALCYADRAMRRARRRTQPVRVELVDPKPRQRGFSVQLGRWVFKRTFAWTARCCRLHATIKPRRVRPSPSSSSPLPPSCSGDWRRRYEAGS
jgi:putative transposase